MFLRRLAILTVCCLLGAYTSSSFAKRTLPTLPLLNPESVEELESGYGIVMFDLDVAGKAPSIVIRRISTQSPFLSAGSKLTFETKPLRIPLTDTKQGFFAQRLKKGLYQITRVDAPFFNLPYKLDIENARAWRFYVAEEQINYAGKLVIEQTRGTEYIDVGLFNRFATDLKEIREAAGRFSESLPLNMATGIRDDFQMLLEQ